MADNGDEIYKFHKSGGAMHATKVKVDNVFKQNTDSYVRFNQPANSIVTSVFIRTLTAHTIGSAADLGYKLGIDGDDDYLAIDADGLVDGGTAIEADAVFHIDLLSATDTVGVNGDALSTVGDTTLTTARAFTATDREIILEINTPNQTIDGAATATGSIEVIMETKSL